MNPVAITGLGCLCAAGSSLEEAMTALLDGRREPRPPVRFQTTLPVPPLAFELPDFEEGAFPRTSALALAAARQALEDAGLAPGDLHGARVGVIIGTSIGATLCDETFLQARRAGLTPEPVSLRRILEANPARLISRTLGLRGPCQTLVNACASGTDALGLGADWIRAGLCDVVLAGGADELSRITTCGFSAMRIADPTPCRPFDRDRQGLNLGEGAAVLVLEAEAFRTGRRAPVQARILGYGAASDAHHPTAPHPEGEGLGRAIRQALAQAGLAPTDLDFVNAHGTATPDNDRVEGVALARELPGIPYFSTKGGTGHTLGAAGALEAAFTVGSLLRREIPGSLGLVHPDPALPAPPVTRRTAIPGRAALSQSLAFGGGNAVIILGRGDA